MKGYSDRKTQEIRDKLEDFGQSEVLRYWGELNEQEKDKLIQQVLTLDFDECQKAWEDITSPSPSPKNLSVPNNVFNEKKTPLKTNEYRELGESLISSSKVAAFTVAGGQGTRLGHSGPKGTFVSGPVSHNTLFRQFAENLTYFSNKFSILPFWFIMTSPANHSQTVDYFKKSNYFGYSEKNIKIFSQDTIPVFDENGNFLLEQKHKIATSPNGHGGSLKALAQSGSLELMKNEGIDYISYFQVDNPLVYCLDPTFIGLHANEEAEMSSKAVRKTEPNEKVGLFVVEGENSEVLEYSDAPESTLNARNPNGTLKFGLGNIAIHMFSRKFVDQLSGVKSSFNFRLPFHAARKKVSAVNRKGIIETPDKPNAIKAEMFVFDALPLAKNSQILEISRNQEFAPIKNAHGSDSIKSSVELQLERAKDWIQDEGEIAEPINNLEISPLYAPTKAYFREERQKNTPYTLHKTKKGTLLLPKHNFTYKDD